MASLDDLEARVRAKVRVNAETGCWEWTASRFRSGYGQLGVGPHGVVAAHRYVYAALVEPIPSGKWVLHHCDNRRCVNPDHLYLGTIVENMRDAVARDRIRPWQRRLTHCKRGHEFTPENTYHAPSAPTHRTCRACLHLASRDRWGRILAARRAA